MRNAILILLTILITSAHVFAKEMVIFTGIPTMKISEGGISRIPENLTKDRAIELKCTITKMDGKYYWTSRENVVLLPIESGAFITYWAANGSGYVRVTKPEMKSELKKMTTAIGAIGDPEERFDYVEHLLLGLKSITYYGTAK